MSWTWQGRQLTTAEKDKKLSFTYDSEGIRTSGAIWRELLDVSTKVYNFEVEDFHTYYVTSLSILVHNSCPQTVKEFLSSQKNARQVLSFLKDRGFKVVSQNGSHIKLVKGGKSVIVPNHGGKDIAIGTLRSILKQAGLL